MISKIMYHLGYILTGIILSIVFGTIGGVATLLNIITGDKFEVVSDIKTDTLELSQESIERVLNQILNIVPWLRQFTSWRMGCW